MPPASRAPYLVGLVPRAYARGYYMPPAARAPVGPRKAHAAEAFYTFGRGASILRPNRGSLSDGLKTRPGRADHKFCSESVADQARDHSFSQQRNARPPARNPPVNQGLC